MVTRSPYDVFTAPKPPKQMSRYTIIIRQINTSGNEGIWDQLHTDDAETGRAWIVKNMHALNTDGTCPKVQTVGNGRVPVTCEVFKNDLSGWPASDGHNTDHNGWEY